ncbi:NADH:flavin oxidoreductase/NADH oxidase [Bosea sp. (in: a-proteobacteria)]|jgi:2,4-dienoyl-CoA reductase-like NADH-dependent reductase (Old Yellow Enzyme family)|uniref:NADH:flavin oxidoreductase/NADH oxidase n=1 Tax=Bosea sp. (in: a-proteobacteria) TaxID=1871050 RepID=UPI002DDCD5E5|nr:NADH:flavin oxidoreductase/NADH oxidase [Bosea sp. (in: a-proteobacteria)]HEV2510299.1 NADH:flavin oxidoreductase/NADH oxidase [Bosea sp. (in: a-proteobacteria)]
MPASIPLLFQPLTIRGVTLRNRIAVSPMAMYCADNGYPVPFHQVHYGKFAMGGAGLVYVEQAAITRTGRITNGCLGLWEDGQAEALAPIAAFLRSQGAVPAIQINHSGRKGSAQRAWEGNGVLTPENLAKGDESWQPLGASDNPFSDNWPVPKPLDQAGLGEIRDAFVATALRALKAGFQIIELHMAHGYLLQSFLSPIANKRTDAYGGSRENRMRFPLEVARAVRAALPSDVPLFARISAVDWIDGGWELDDSVSFARELKLAGVDLVDCSSGGNLLKGATNSNLTRSPGYQAPFARRLRAEAGVMSQAVGLIRSPEFAEALLQEGAADIIAIGRQMLFDPFWAHHAAEALGQTGAFEAWPKPYAWWLEKWSSGLRASGERPAA